MFSMEQELGQTERHMLNSEASTALAERLEKEGLCGLPISAIFRNVHQFRRFLWIAIDLKDEFTSTYDLNSHPTWGYEENGPATMQDVVHMGIDSVAIAAAMVEAAKNAPSITIQTKHRVYKCGSDNVLKMAFVYRTFWSDGRYESKERGAETAAFHQETLDAFRKLFGASVVSAWRNNVDGPLLGCTDYDDDEIGKSIYLRTRTEQGDQIVCLTGGFSL